MNSLIFCGFATQKHDIEFGMYKIGFENIGTEELPIFKDKFKPISPSKKFNSATNPVKVTSLPLKKA